jgi:hypothetical protein
MVGDMAVGVRANVRPAFVAVLLVVLGIALWLGYRVFAGTESHAYSPNAVPPDTVRVTANRTYELGYSGGVRGLADQGLNPASLSCIWTRPGASAPSALAVDGYSPDSLSRNGVASFTAPTSGDIHIMCDGLGAMFVDDSDDASADPSGWLLLAATIVLTLGAALTMAVLRATPRGGEAAAEPPHHATWTAGEDDEVARLVRIVHDRAAEDDRADEDGRR